jgi:diacylglycerol kinase family enzyme
MALGLSIVVIVNAGAGKATDSAHVVKQLGDLFRAAGHDAEIVAMRRGENPAEVARSASSRFSIVAAAGGDGTVSSVAAGILDSPATLGVLPLGTLNHFAKDLHIPLDLPQAVAVVTAGQVRLVDIGQVNDRVFINNSSIGIYPNIVEARDELRRGGHGKWTAMALATLRHLRGYRGMAVDIDAGRGRQTRRTPFVFVGNNEYAIEGIGFGGRARLDEGKLFVYLAPRARAGELPGLLAKALIGRASRSGEFEIVSGTELRIDTRRPVRTRVACDGEVVPMLTPLSYRTRPRALRVLAPRT